MYISILLHLGVAVQVWPQAAFRQHPFLVADLYLPQQPDIGDLYIDIYLHDINYKDELDDTGQKVY